MLEIAKGSKDFTRDELDAAKEMNENDNRTSRIKWYAACATILGLGICWIRNKYGKKSPVKKKEEEPEKK